MIIAVFRVIGGDIYPDLLVLEFEDFAPFQSVRYAPAKGAPVLVNLWTNESFPSLLQHDRLHFRFAWTDFTKQHILVVVAHRRTLLWRVRRMSLERPILFDPFQLLVDLVV